MLEELKYILGIQIHKTKKRTFINQDKYRKYLLKRFDMEKSKIIATTMSTSCYLDKNEDKKSVDERKYRGMIGFLIYVTASRIYIMFFVCMCA